MKVVPPAWYSPGGSTAQRPFTTEAPVPLLMAGEIGVGVSEGQTGGMEQDLSQVFFSYLDLV